MPTVAILPVKTFGAAKQRLRDHLDPGSREALVQAMFTDVLNALRLTDLEQIVVVTASQAARRIAIELGAEVLVDTQTGHNAAARLGVEAALGAGAERALLVPGDCPALDPQELRDLLDHPLPSPSAIIVPDRHGAGTNALLLTPPDSLPPSYGPGSCQRHLELARARGISAEIIEVPSLGLDIDTPDDIATLAAAPPDRAAHTRRLLTQPSRC